MSYNGLPNTVMTLSEVAEYLKMAERTIMRMVNRGEIPGMKIASQWRFLKPVIDDWLFGKVQPPRGTSLSALIESGEEVPISRIITLPHINLDLKGRSREKVLENLITPLVKEAVLTNPKEYIRKLLEREAMASTAIAHHVAIPHIRNVRENPADRTEILLGISKEGFPYGAPDGDPTYLFFLICTDNEVIHLRLISKLFLIIRDRNIVSRLMQAKSKEEIMSIIIQEEYNEL